MSIGKIILGLILVALFISIFMNLGSNQNEIELIGDADYGETIAQIEAENEELCRSLGGSVVDEIRSCVNITEDQCFDLGLYDTQYQLDCDVEGLDCSGYGEGICRLPIF